MSQPPRNAQSLLDLRMSGDAPADPVLVSLVGSLRHANLTLYADAGAAHDWRCIAALDVEVFASTSVPFADLLRTLADLAAAVPRHMVLTFVEGPRVECGEMRTLQDFALFDWFPIAIGPSAWDEGTVIARRLLDALGKELPIPYDHAVRLVGEVMQEGQQCV